MCGQRGGCLTDFGHPSLDLIDMRPTYIQFWELIFDLLANIVKAVHTFVKDT